MSKTIAEVKNIYKSFGTGEGRVNVLNGASFEMKEGEFLSIMGPSGCGKSSLLYIIGGLEKADSGRVITCGANISRLSDKEQSEMRLNDIGFVFQFCNLVQNLSVEENILLPIIMSGKNPNAYKERMTELLHMMDIESKQNVLPSKLSGGQQQRVAIARAVIAKPSLILADEPTGNLDSVSGRAVLDIFTRLNQEEGVSIIMVTHSEEAASCGSRILRMKDGKF